MKRLVIIGNGGAALSALRAIRSTSRLHRIALISSEACPAYSPVLTPYYVAGSLPYHGMFLCRRDFYRRHGVRAILGDRAVSVEPATRQVVLASGEAVPYDELLIATGSSVAVPPIPGAAGCLTLWSAGEARQLREQARRAQRVAVVGAGLIGLQIVDALRQRGKRLTLIEMQEQVLPRVLDKEAAAILEERLHGAGVELRLREQVREVLHRDGARELRLSSGDMVEAEAVVFATGVSPNTALLASSGVSLSPGVVVDEGGRTNVEHIFAAGDVAQGTDQLTGRSQINATWTNAVEGGWVAGLNMAGGRASRWRNTRVNILSPLGLPIASLGLVEPQERGDEESVRRNGSFYQKLIFRHHRLVGAVLVGEVEAAGILNNLMERDGLFPQAEARLRQRSAYHLLAGPQELFQ